MYVCVCVCVCVLAISKMSRVYIYIIKYLYILIRKGVQGYDHEYSTVHVIINVQRGVKAVGVTTQASCMLLCTSRLCFSRTAV